MKVVYHSCGSIYDVIPDLIAVGDVIHPIQALPRYGTEKAEAGLAIISSAAPMLSSC